MKIIWICVNGTKITKILNLLTKTKSLTKTNGRKFILFEMLKKKLLFSIRNKYIREIHTHKTSFKATNFLSNFSKSNSSNWNKNYASTLEYILLLNSKLFFNTHRTFSLLLFYILYFTLALQYIFFLISLEIKFIEYHLLKEKGISFSFSAKYLKKERKNEAQWCETHMTFYFKLFM